MYTELIIKCDLVIKKDSQVEEVLNFLFNDKPMKIENVPDHKFFKCPRWDLVGNCSSFYHTPQSFSYYDGKYLFSRSDLKDYDNEIMLFLDWLYPYIDEEDDRILGWTWYEENEKPEMITRSSILKNNLTNRKSVL